MIIIVLLKNILYDLSGKISIQLENGKKVTIDFDTNNIEKVE